MTYYNINNNNKNKKKNVKTIQFQTFLNSQIAT